MRDLPKESVGDILRDARLKKGITESDVEKATKIPPRYVEAMEQMSWDVFPAEVYLRGFLRSYAKFLGLDPELVISLYERDHTFITPKLTDISEVYPAPPRFNLQVILIIAFFGIGILLLITGIYFIAQSDFIQNINTKKITSYLQSAIAQTPTPTTTPGITATATPTPVETSAPLIIPPTAPPAKTTPKATATATVTQAPTNTPTMTVEASKTPTRTPLKKPVRLGKGVDVRVLATKSTFIHIQVDDEDAYVGMLRENEEKVWKAERNATLVKIGNPANVQLWINGALQELKGTQPLVWKSE